jgi:hypothetical protein
MPTAAHGVTQAGIDHVAAVTLAGQRREHGA